MPYRDSVLFGYSSRFTMATARTSGSQREEGKRRLYNHSIFALTLLQIVWLCLACKLQA